ncbi:MAG: CDP-diacylglycerol---glycerol-3-phosphate 3-phosphatidyltransferase [Clostridiales bacterium]|jgi:CDP-diacylglycerol--glycerol-3-phosphate 3-phosphatidyltransferase|nr:CDP-diacylglycerol---glycerol-3-phosphate 3-phosphatidyltransferase [Clostridiales bacterium]
MKQIPNSLTIVRMALTIALLWLYPLGNGFFVVYLIAGLTDIIDGPLARWLGAESRFGAKLDSAADTLFVFVVLVRLWPYLVLPPVALLFILGIALLRVGAGVVAKLRFGVFGFLHTWGNKLTGALLFLYPFVLRWPVATGLFWVAGVVALFSAAEELVIELTAPAWQPDRPGYFFQLPKKQEKNRK